MQLKLRSENNMKLIGSALGCPIVATGLLLVLLTPLCAATGARPDPAYATNITIYHVNPLTEGLAPIDM